MKKDLAIGYDSFSDLIGNNCYYVDKTQFLKTVLQDKSKVMFITCPRRFGKTLFMSTLESFLRIDSKNPGSTHTQETLFDGLNVSKDSEFCSEYMGQFPTVFVSFKDVYGQCFEDVQRLMAETIQGAFFPFRFLLESKELTAQERNLISAFVNLDFSLQAIPKGYLEKSLQMLVSALAKHFKKPAVLLIDEYDVPLAKASKKSYYDAVLNMLRQMLSQVLKPRDVSQEIVSQSYLKKAILTGCLRVSKESIFTGLNNPAINTVWSEDLSLSDSIGFTPMEVSQLLDYFGLASRSEDVKLWYDGYKFAGKDIYCPWDVINFADQAIKSGKPRTFEPRNYWANTSSNEAIQDFLGFLGEQDAEKMQTLVDGNSIEIDVNDQLNYGNMKEHRSQDFWTLLLATGYLTLVNSSPKGSSNTTYEVKIPNREILETFKTNIQAYFSTGNPSYAQSAQAIVHAILAGRTNEVSVLLKTLLRGFVSVRDTATKAPSENFYHGFLNGIFSCAGSLVSNYKSQPEAGNGYADIAFLAETTTGRIGVVIEIKYCKDPDDLYEAAEVAISQIHGKGYGAYFDKLGCPRKLVYGIAFCRKDCAVAAGQVPTKNDDFGW